jgi:hypothetical protein
VRPWWRGWPGSARQPGPTASAGRCPPLLYEAILLRSQGGGETFSHSQNFRRWTSNIYVIKTSSLQAARHVRAKTRNSMNATQPLLAFRNRPGCFLVKGL